MVHPTKPESGQAGELFAARYRKIEMLGAGGMGTVWLAEKTGPGNFTQRVVIKQIHEHMAQQPEFITRFQDEARLAGLLHHPNIVGVEDFGNADGVPYLVMEHIQGTDLPELVSVFGQLPLRIVLSIGVDIAKALAYAHELKDFDGNHLKVVHRDVSPQNIMINRNGDAKLLDFGIARATSNQVETSVGVVKGKLGYLSPEQVEGRGLDGRSDQFTLGIVLYELLVGGRLFDGKSDLGILTRIQKADVPHLGRMATDLPEGLTAIIMRCLQRTPGARFDDCNQLAKALATALRSIGGRYSADAFQAWWSQGSVVGDPHTAQMIRPLSTQGLVDEVFSSNGESDAPEPDEQTVIAQSGEIVAPVGAPEEPTLIARTADLKQAVDRQSEDTRVISTPGMVLNTTTEPTTITREGADPRVASGDSDADGRTLSPSSHGTGELDVGLPPESHSPEPLTNASVEEPSLGGPVATIILLALAIIMGAIWFQSMGTPSNPGEALVEQDSAP